MALIAKSAHFVLLTIRSALDRDRPRTFRADLAHFSEGFTENKGFLDDMENLLLEHEHKAS